MNLDKLFSKCEVKIKINSRDAQKVKSTRLVIKVADGKTGKVIREDFKLRPD